MGSGCEQTSQPVHKLSDHRWCDSWKVPHLSRFTAHAGGAGGFDLANHSSLSSPGKKIQVWSGGHEMTGPKKQQLSQYQREKTKRAAWQRDKAAVTSEASEASWGELMSEHEGPFEKVLAWVCLRCYVMLHHDEGK